MYIILEVVFWVMWWMHFSGCFPPKYANHINPYWFHTGVMKRFWCLPFADWLKRNDIENLFRIDAASIRWKNNFLSSVNNLVATQPILDEKYI